MNHSITPLVTEAERVKPFHQWKHEQVQADSKARGVVLYYRLREWYWQAYGNCCQKIRNQKR